MAKIPAIDKTKEYFIKGNMEILSVVDIANKLKMKPEYVEYYKQEYFKARDKRRTRFMEAMQTPVKGVIAMTQAASEMSDDIYNKKVITQSDVNVASLNGDYELAAKLAEQMESQYS